MRMEPKHRWLSNSAFTDTSCNGLGVPCRCVKGLFPPGCGDTWLGYSRKLPENALGTEGKHSLHRSLEGEEGMRLCGGWDSEVAWMDGGDTTGSFDFRMLKEDCDLVIYT